jgi:hypothetical protein
MQAGNWSATTSDLSLTVIAEHHYKSRNIYESGAGRATSPHNQSSVTTQPASAGAAARSSVVMANDRRDLLAGSLPPTVDKSTYLWTSVSDAP